MNNYFNIHPLISVVFIIAYLTGNFKNTLIIYVVAMVHEFFHLITAYKLKVKIKGISVMPFGITLKIKDNRIQNPIHEIIIAAAGPFSNLIMIFIASILKSNPLFSIEDMTFFIFANILIAFINIIPVIPLDGGRILKSILILKWGFIKAFNFMKKVTMFIGFILFILGIYLLYITKFNYSLFLISLFLIFNLSIEKENNNLTIMYEILNYKQKLTNKNIFKTRHIAIMHDTPSQELLKLFSYNYFYIIIIIDSKMEVVGILTETQIIEGLISFGSQVTVGNILQNS